MLLSEIPIPDFCIGCPLCIEKAFAGDRYSGHCLNEMPDPINGCPMRASAERHHAERIARKTPLALLKDWLHLYDGGLIKVRSSTPPDLYEGIIKKTREFLEDRT